MACIKKFDLDGAKIEIYNDFIFEDKKNIKHIQKKYNNRYC